MSENEEKKETKVVQLDGNPFLKQQHESLSMGTVEIESSRAIAEAQGKLIIAKRFPRDEHQAFARAIESCQRRSLAESALYEFPRGGQTITGPSIRFAEELARCWGNLDFGIRELSQKENESEMEAYCWDLQTNVFSSQKFTVKHERHTRNGVVKLTDPRDKYELVTNNAARRLRARILAVMPPDYIEAALEQVKKTLSGEPKKAIADRVQDMLKRFSDMGVTKKKIEAFLGKVVDKINGEDLSNLVGIFNTINDGIKDVGDYFDVKDSTQSAIDQVNNDEKGPKKSSPKKADEKKEEAPKTEAPKAEEKKADQPEMEKPEDKAKKVAEATSAEPKKEEAPSQESAGPGPDDDDDII